MAKSRKAATLLSFATKDMGRCRPRLARPHARGSPFHLDVQVELFPEVVVQGRDLRLEVLIHHCAVGQCLQGRGLPYVIVHLLSLMGLTITRTEPKGHGELSTPIHLCFLNVGARGQPPQWWTHSLQTVSQKPFVRATRKATKPGRKLPSTRPPSYCCKGVWGWDTWGLKSGKKATKLRHSDDCSH